jgi:hypothetical protein
VIVTPAGAGDTIARCLGALVPQVESRGGEVLVVSPPGAPRPAEGSAVLTWLDAAGEDDVPRMRARGIGQARGRVVALLEDDCVVGDGWAAAVLAAGAGGRRICGGPIRPDGPRRALDAAVFFCEYARFLPPLPAAPRALPGNNAAYDPALLREWLDGPGQGRFEDVFAHDAWRARGLALHGEEGMAVRHVGRWTAGTPTRDAYHHGRAYAGRRAARAGMGARLALAAGSSVLPLLKTARVMGEVLGRGRGHAGSLAGALPWIIVFHSSWAWGELLGYLFGPGRSAERWGRAR